MTLNTQYQSGQAITEFNVTAAFLLVPLFIMIPLLGKYIDMKHSSVQAARYMAWERTVWFEEKTKPKDTTTARVKSHNQLVKETRQRIFSGVVEDSLAGGDINPLWNDRGNNIIKSADDVDMTFLNGGNEDVLKMDDDNNPANDKQSYSYKFIEVLSEGVGITANAMGELLSAAIRAFNSLVKVVAPGAPNLPEPKRPDVMGKFQFKGYYRSDVQMNIDNNQYVSIFKTKAPVIASQASVLTDSWVVEGGNQFAEWTDSFVPFSPLRTIFEPIKTAFTLGGIDALKTIAPAPEFADLNFGYVDTDPVTDSSYIPDNLCPDGLCSYEELP